MQESLDTTEDLQFVDWGKDRLIVQRVKHERSCAPVEAGRDSSDTEDQGSPSPARSEIAKPLRAFSKARPTAAVAKAGMQASESLRKLIAKAQTTAAEMDRQKEAANAEIMAMAEQFEKDLTSDKKKRKPVAADREHSAGKSRRASAGRGRGSNAAAAVAAGREPRTIDAGAVCPGAPASGKGGAASARGRSSKCDGAGRDTSGNPD